MSHCWHIWLGQAWVLVGGSDTELLLDPGMVTHLPSDTFYPFQPHDFQGKAQSVTLRHYPLQHNTAPLWFKAPYASLTSSVIASCPHVSLNSLCPPAPPSSSLYYSFNTVFFFGTVVLLPFPHALCALLQGCDAKPWAAVLVWRWGWDQGPARVCQEGSSCFDLSPFRKSGDFYDWS